MHVEQGVSGLRIGFGYFMCSHFPSWLGKGCKWELFCFLGIFACPYYILEGIFYMFFDIYWIGAFMFREVLLGFSS